ncbi:hypothetical protein [Marivita sp. GX14005]|uniref:hypothetical protein n=1 Tax=Marivita sp. GX14005 TaxID=2942276 RepID=UPI0020195977|nr:hypothetical protein [Marivita sp. GX14005]MCL3880882.1 hypothetical protein [Marivita sp. GX14005]
MLKKSTLAICTTSALTLAACADDPEPMAQTTPIYAKDGTIIGQTVVVPERQGSAAPGVISEQDDSAFADGVDIDDDNMDESDDG